METIVQHLESFLFEAVTASYLKDRNWKTAFLPFRNSDEIDATFTTEISRSYGNNVITLDYENINQNSSRIAIFDLKDTDVYEIKKENELNSFIITNDNIDFIIVYGPFDHTCICGSEKFVKSLISKKMMQDYYEEIKTYSSKSNKAASLQMYSHYQKERLLAYCL